MLFWTGRLGEVHGVEIPGRSGHYEQEGFQGRGASRGSVIGASRASSGRRSRGFEVELGSGRSSSNYVENSKSPPGGCRLQDIFLLYIYALRSAIK